MINNLTQVYFDVWKLNTKKDFLCLSLAFSVFYCSSYVSLIDAEEYTVVVSSDEEEPAVPESVSNSNR